MSRIKSFVKEFIAVIKGDDSAVLAEKVYRQVSSALQSQIASLQGDTIGKEDKITDAKENLANVRLNHGKLITDRNSYVSNLLSVKNSLIEAEEALEKHTAKLTFLKEELVNLDNEVEA